MGLKPVMHAIAGPPKELVLRYCTRRNLQTFIECGTYLAETAIWAARHFPHVTTIEASKELYERVKPQHAQFPNIKFAFGDSRIQLAEIVPSLNGGAVFWLDSHWSGGVTFGKSDECPIMKELEIINDSPYQNLILVDDARLFLAPPEPPLDANFWPDLPTVADALRGKRGDRFVALIDDVLVAGPSDWKAEFATCMNEMRISRRMLPAEASSRQKGMMLMKLGMSVLLGRTAI